MKEIVYVVVGRKGGYYLEQIVGSLPTLDELQSIGQTLKLRILNRNVREIVMVYRDAAFKDAFKVSDKPTPGTLLIQNAASCIDADLAWWPEI